MFFEHNKEQRWQGLKDGEMLCGVNRDDQGLGSTAAETPEPINNVHDMSLLQSVILGEGTGIFAPFNLMKRKEKLSMLPKYFQYILLYPWRMLLPGH